MSIPNRMRRKTVTAPQVEEVEQEQPNPELLPCAHCGSSGKVVRLTVRDGYYITCSRDALKNDEFCGIETPITKTLDDAVAIWNRRKKGK